MENKKIINVNSIKDTYEKNYKKLKDMLDRERCLSYKDCPKEVKPQNSPLINVLFLDIYGALDGGKFMDNEEYDATFNHKKLKELELLLKQCPDLKIITFTTYPKIILSEKNKREYHPIDKLFEFSFPAYVPYSMRNYTLEFRIKDAFEYNGFSCISSRIINNINPFPIDDIDEHGINLNNLELIYNKIKKYIERYNTATNYKAIVRFRSSNIYNSKIRIDLKDPIIVSTFENMKQNNIPFNKEFPDDINSIGEYFKSK